jgi:PAS domain S-box-containing protein
MMKRILNLIRRNSIRIKLAIITTLLIGIISVFIFLYFPKQIEQRELETIEIKAKSISEMTAFNIGSALALQDTKSVKKAFNATKLNKSLIYMAVTDDSNKVIEAFRDAKAIRGNLPGTENRWLTQVGSQVGDIYRITTKIRSNNQEIGKLFLGFSLKELKSKVKESQTTIALVSLAVFLIGMILIFGISTAITNPLAKIVKTVEQIAHGDLTKRAPVTSNDEVGYLAKSFNLMVDNLQKAHQELEDMNHNLEERVEARTKELQQEINERKQTEVALRESEEKYRTIFEGSRDAVYITTKEGKIISVNDALLNMFGFNRDEADSFNTQESYANPEDRIKFQKMIEGSGYVKNFEVKLLKKDGAPMDCLITSTAWHDEDGKFLGYHGIIIDITERKQKEEEVKLLKKQIEFILGATKTGLNIIDSDYNIRYVDPEWAKIYGDYQEKKCYEYFFGRDAICANCGIAQAVKTEKIVVKESILPKEGNRPIQVVTLPFRDDNGLLLYAEVNVDIRERKIAEESLKQSEKKYRQLVELAQEGIWMIDADLKTTFVNPRMAEILGYTVEEMLDKNLFSFMDEQGIEICKTNIERRKKGIKGQHDFEFIRKDGTQIYTSLETNPITDQNGKYVGALAVVADITERKRAEEALHKLNRSLKALSSCNEVLVRATDETNLLKEICRLIVEVGGYRLAWVGFTEMDTEKTLRPVAHAGSDTGQLQNLKISLKNQESGNNPAATAIRTGKPCIVNNTLTDPNYANWHKQLTELGIASSIAIPLIADSKTFGLLYIYAHEVSAFDNEEVKLLTELANDLTYGIKALRTRDEQKQAEAEIRKLNEELEERVKERTVELEQAYEQLRTTREQFYQAQKMESIGILAGGIAHDFNNLLATIVGNISLAKMMSQTDDKMSHILTRAENVSLRAKDLTQQLLTFSKGGVPVKKNVSIPKIIRDSVNLALRGSNVSCKFSLPDNIWSVEADEAQLIQVINNLIINANQAMPEGGFIEVSAENVKINPEANLPLESGNYVKITIQDQGIGISEENLAKIYDPFFSTKSNGTGLGLTTVYSIIKKHNGHIKVDSKIGTGTTFQIYFPTIDKQILSKKVIKEQPKAKPPKQAQLDNNKILIMDDESNVLETLEAILAHFGYEATCAKDGAEALKLYQAARDAGTPFAAVIMDLTIKGGMGGKETIIELLKIDPKVKTIVSSGYSNDPIMADHQKYGFKGVVAKPYKAEDIVMTLNKILQESNKEALATSVNRF